MARPQALASKFEAPAHLQAANVAPVAVLATAQPLPAVDKPLPRRVMVEATIGWMQGGVLRQFHEDQVVHSRADIHDLIQQGASLLVIEP
jgi:hypothetical protein